MFCACMFSVCIAVKWLKQQPSDQKVPSSSSIMPRYAQLLLFPWQETFSTLLSCLKQGPDANWGSSPWNLVITRKQMLTVHVSQSVDS